MRMAAQLARPDAASGSSVKKNNISIIIRKKKKKPTQTPPKKQKTKSDALMYFHKFGVSFLEKFSKYKA